MKVRYKRTAIEDIQETEHYIRSVLGENPYMGTPLSSRFEVETDLRYLLVSEQLIFYRVVEDQTVEVIRVLNGRQDYLSILF